MNIFFSQKIVKNRKNQQQQSTPTALLLVLLLVLLVTVMGDSGSSIYSSLQRTTYWYQRTRRYLIYGIYRSYVSYRFVRKYNVHLVINM